MELTVAEPRLLLFRCLRQIASTWRLFGQQSFPNDVDAMIYLFYLLNLIFTVATLVFDLHLPFEIGVNCIKVQSRKA